MAYLAPFLAFGVLLVVAILVGGLRKRREKRRSERLASLANQSGWRSVSAHDPTHHDQREAFHCFSSGHSRHAHNQMQGAIDVVTTSSKKLSLPFEAGDFHYRITRSTSQHRHTDTYRFSYLLVDTVSDNGFLSVNANRWGRGNPGENHRIENFGSPDFDKRYHVACDEEAYAREVLHRSMVDLLVDSKIDRFEIRSGWLCLCGDKKRWSPDEFSRRIQWAERFFELWPRGPV